MFCYGSVYIPSGICVPFNSLVARGVLGCQSGSKIL